VLRLKEPDGQWEVLLPMEGHGGIRVDAAWAGDEGLYVMLDRDLVRWDEGRHRFVAVGNRPVLSWVPELASDGESIWAQVSSNEVQRSLDGGRTWTVTPQPTPDLGNVTAVAAQLGVVWVGTGFDGVFRSNDGGATWTSLEDRLPHVNGMAGDQPWGVTDLLADGDGLFQSTAAMEFAGGTDGNFVSTGVGILHSDDGGDSWSVYDRGIPPGNLGRRSPTGPLWQAAGDLFTGTDEGYFRSTDRGRSWTGPIAIPGEEVTQLTGLVELDGRLLAAHRLAEEPFGGIFASDDRGATWRRQSGALPGVPRMLLRIRHRLVLLVDPGAQGAVVWSSTNGGDTWEVLGEDPPQSGETLLATAHELLLGTAGEGVRRLPLDALDP
jgi:photosystem II stability/assembly factor-like uncharacterized protein